jgi:streptogramin lyase
VRHADGRGHRAAFEALGLLIALVFLLAACTAGSSAGKGSITPAFVSYDGPVPTSVPPVQQVPTDLPKGVMTSIPTRPGDAPVAAVSGFGSVWIPSHRGTTLYRIDPRTDHTTKIDMGQDCFNAAQIGDGHVFIACDQTEVVVDPKTNTVVGSSDCGQYVSFAPGAIWSGGAPGGMQLCSLKRFQRTGLDKIGDGYSGTAYGFGSVWAANGLDHTVARIDPSTGKIITSIPADGIQDGDYDCHVLVAYGFVWNQCDPSDKIYRIDPATDTSEAFTINAPALPDFYVRPLVAGLGSLWLTTSLYHVTRFDPNTMKVIGRYPVDPSGKGSGAITVDDGSLWVTNPEADTIWRDRIKP